MAEAMQEETPLSGHGPDEVADRLARARAGGPERHRRKVAEQGKLMPRERIRLLFDENSEFVEDGLL
ncbi:MAG: acyl-CoA carboxylase subunit beta, partial [Candidatus Dormibacteria bacterium]